MAISGTKEIEVSDGFDEPERITQIEIIRGAKETEDKVGEDEPNGKVVSDDDCEVVSDDDCDQVHEQASDNEDDLYALCIQEEGCETLERYFGEAARDDEDETDAESGDDIWNDKKILDSLSSSDDEEAEEERHREIEDSNELLTLGNTFNSLEDFKLAVLRYSLKTRYDIKLYMSQSMKIGTKYCDTDFKCQWRVYCSYEKRKHNMQIKVNLDKHTCVRLGYTKMLKRSTIAYLFAERLRLNPKLTKQEMAYEIKRGYNLVVSDDQCGKAKTKIMREKLVMKHILHGYGTIKRRFFGVRFYRLYICFNCQRESWKQTCEPIIGLDGAF